MPFAGYKNFDECVRKNKNKKDPEAYCGAIKHKVEDMKNILEKIQDNEDILLELDDVIKRGEHSRCVDRLEYLGFSKEEAQLMCAALYIQDTKLFGEKHEPTKKELRRHEPRYDPRTRHHGGHPTHVEIGVVPRAMALPLQVPHRPPKSEHIMRTKMEKLQTEEEKWLTLEQLAKRASYQREVQKRGKGVMGTKKHRTMQLYRTGDTSLIEMLDDIKNLMPKIEDDMDALEFAYDNDLIEEEELIYKHEDFTDSMIQKTESGMSQDEAYVETLRDLFKDSEDFIYGTEDVILDSSKSSLKNAKKIPVILAREIIQKYKGDKGIEKHFKPFDELKKSIKYVDELPIIIEHKKFNDNDVVGYVKELRADEKDRSIKGFAYLHESRLPSPIQNALDDGEKIPVSIGFRATLGDSGTYNGEPYDKTQKNIILNHLAIVVNSTPRCDVPYCGLNLDSYDDDLEDSKDDNILVLIKKDAQYYNIGDSFKEEKENNINLKKENDSIEEMEYQDFKDIIGKLLEDKSLTEEEKKKVKEKLEKEKEKEDSTPGWIVDLVLKNLDQVLPLPIKREDSKDMADDKELEELKSKIAELEDTLSEKEEEIKAYEEKERKTLVDSILSVSNKYDEEDLEDMCLAELKIREDAVSEFKPSQKKPKKLGMRTDSEIKDSKRINPREIFLEKEQ